MAKDDAPPFRPHGDPLLSDEDLSRRVDDLARQTAGEDLLGDEQAPARLLAFYDRLRRRVVAAVERRGGRLGAGATELLLTLPDVFILLVRLALDPEVPGRARAAIGGAVAYFVLPLDIFPEALLGPLGFTEDALIAAAGVLALAMSPEIRERVEHHWSGSGRALEVLEDLVETAPALLPSSVLERVDRFFARRGIRLASTGVGRRAAAARVDGEEAEDDLEDAWDEDLDDEDDDLDGDGGEEPYPEDDDGYDDPYRSGPQPA